MLSKTCCYQFLRVEMHTLTITPGVPRNNFNIETVFLAHTTKISPVPKFGLDMLD